MQHKESNSFQNIWIPSHTSTGFDLTKILCRETEHMQKCIDFIFKKKGTQTILEESHILVAINYLRTHDHCEFIHSHIIIEIAYQFLYKYSSFTQLIMYRITHRSTQLFPNLIHSKSSLTT